MHRFSVHEAKTHLSRLLAMVANGEEVIVTKSGKPVARLGPYREGMALTPLDKQYQVKTMGDIVGPFHDEWAE